MIPYTLYFDEWNTPPAGIDTIAIWIKSTLINRFDIFHERGNIHEAINCRRKEIRDKNGHVYWANYLLEIQAEALNPDEDILQQIIVYLTKLVEAGILKNIRNANLPAVAHFFMMSFSSHFAVHRLDFYFDVKEGDITPVGYPHPSHPNTYYSGDYPSSLKTYSRVCRLLHKNGIPSNRIQGMEYRNRIEFHLARSNCDYLHYQNLSGPFEAVFYRYLPLLARKWYQHRREVMEVPHFNTMPYARHLRQINDMAYAGHIPQYRDLQKTPLLPIPEKRYKKNEADQRWLTEFVTQ